jgi:hypothetical protein
VSAQRTNTSGVSFGLARGIAVDPHGWVYISGNGDTRDQLNAPDWTKTRSQLMVVNFAEGGNGDVIPIQTDNNPASRFDAYDASKDTDPNRETGAIGVGLDIKGNAWMVNHTGTAIRFKPNHEEGVVRVDLNTRDVLKAAGKTPQPGLYTYSDFTGHQLRYVPQGHVRFYLNACTGQQTPVWQGIAWEGSTKPPVSEIRVEVLYGTEANVKNNIGTPKTYEDTEPGTEKMRTIPLNDVGEPSQWMSVTFYLMSTDGQTLPVLRDFAVYVQCISDLK